MREKDRAREREHIRQRGQSERERQSKGEGAYQTERRDMKESMACNPDSLEYFVYIF